MTTLRARDGFTLLEMSVVLAIIGVIMSGSMTLLSSNFQNQQLSITKSKLQTIRNTLYAFRAAYGRIPCPADATIAQTAANFGIEASTAGDCISTGTIKANFSGGGNVEGMVPAKTLNLPDDYAFDGWGRRIMYAVDQLYTASAGFTTNAISTAGTVTISNGAGLGTKASAVYALLSFGPNGHGSYPRSGGSTRFNAGSVNTDEHTNCNCNSSATATTFNSTFVQRMPSLDPANALDTFDDLVAFATRMQLSLPTEAPSTSPTWNFWVTEQNNNRVQEFNSSGSFVSAMGAGYNGVSGSIGSCGSGNGQFCGPWGIRFDASGNMWVADGGNNRVVEFNSSGTYLMSIGTGYQGAGGTIGNTGSGNGQFYEPSGIAFDASGNIWVTEQNNNRVQEFNSSGTFLRGIGCGYNGISGSIGSSGTGNGKLNNPYDVAIDASGNVWVVDYLNNRVQEFNSSGTYLRKFGSQGSGNGQLSQPGGIAIDASGNLWVTEQDNQRVSEFNSSGTFLSIFGGPYGTGNGQFTDPQGITIDSSGNFWVEDYNNNNVQEFNSSGTYLSKFGSSGSGNGQFNNPNYVVIH